MSVSVKPFLWSSVLCRSHTTACSCLCVGDDGSEQHQSWGLVFQKTCTFLQDLSPTGILGGALYIYIIKRVSLKISDIGIYKYMIVEIKFDFCDIKLTGIKMQPGTKKTSIAEDDRVVLVYRTHVGRWFIYLLCIKDNNTFLI